MIATAARPHRAPARRVRALLLGLLDQFLAAQERMAGGGANGWHS